MGLNLPSDAKRLWQGAALLRIVMGAGFLYAGLAKLLQIGGAKPFTAAGYLQFGTAGTWPGAAEGAVVNPTQPFWVALGQNPGVVDIVNFLVVFGEIAIGTCLILGLVARFAGMMGAIMVSLFYVSSWDFGHGLVNQQLLYVAICGFVAYVGAGRYFGLDATIEKSGALQRSSALRQLAGLMM
jgi:thiosulfate dehydrogenase [quinone] large subunit